MSSVTKRPRDRSWLDLLSVSVHRLNLFLTRSSEEQTGLQF